MRHDGGPEEASRSDSFKSKYCSNSSKKDRDEAEQLSRKDRADGTFLNDGSCLYVPVP